MKILVSACLLGLCCRYDGNGKPEERVLRLMDRHQLIPVCPEILGGLPTPRPAAEQVGDRVMTKDGADVTEQYKKGADEAVKLARLFDCQAAVLKERSPSCGHDWIYDGSFQHVLTEGDGITAQALKACGIFVLGESECEEIERFL